MLQDESQFSVAVVATMSAGKSTTLNAMLGIPLLPARNEACTAVLTKIADVDEATEIQARVLSKDGAVSEWKKIDGSNCKLLEQWNSIENKCVEIKGDFPHISRHLKSIQFIDTPGPNNSRDKTHLLIADQAISDCQNDYLIFVINATQFGVDDERILLEKLCVELKNKNRIEKIVFVVNKIDQLNLEEGESPLKLINVVHAYLEHIGFVNPNVIPVMSQISLDVRQCLNAFSKGLELPFSLRSQKRILSEIKFSLEYFSHYLEALLNSTRKEVYLDRAFGQRRKIQTNEAINIAGTLVPIDELIEVDLLSGIPTLEEMLELELMKVRKNSILTSNIDTSMMFVSQAENTKHSKKPLLGKKSN